MSDLETLKKENDGLKQQLQQNSQGVNGLLAQLDAAKQVIQEHINNGLGLRTNLILLDKQAKQFQDHFQKQDNEIKSLKDQLDVANKKVAELTPAPVVEQPVVEDGNY